jgi:hypothetical protein
LEDVGAGLKVILKGLKSEQVDWFDLAWHGGHCWAFWVTELCCLPRMDSALWPCLSVCCCPTEVAITFSPKRRVCLWRVKPELTKLEPFTTAFSGHVERTETRIYRQRTRTSLWPDFRVNDVNCMINWMRCKLGLLH